MERLAGRDSAWLARESGVSTSAVSDYIGGKLPRADKAVALARTLGVSVEWLFTGAEAGTKPAPGLRAVDDADFVWIPRLDLFDWRAAGPPPEIEAVPVRRDWLYGLLRRSGGLWFSDMPDASLPDVAAEGATIVCEEPSGPHLTDGGVYVFWRGGELMVRRARRGPAGTMLVAEDAEPIRYPDPQAEEHDQWRAIARVLGTFGLREL